MTGVVISVEGEGPASVQRFTVRANDGRAIVFELERLDVTAGKPAAHLREHLVSGEPVTIAYTIENGRHIALSYDDAE